MPGITVLWCFLFTDTVCHPSQAGGACRGTSTMCRRSRRHSCGPCLAASPTCCRTSTSSSSRCSSRYCSKVTSTTYDPVQAGPQDTFPTSCSVQACRCCCSRCHPRNTSPQNTRSQSTCPSRDSPKHDPNCVVQPGAAAHGAGHMTVIESPMQQAALAELPTRARRRRGCTFMKCAFCVLSYWVTQLD